MYGERKIASAALEVLRQQRREAERGKLRFGDWHGALAEALSGPIADSYVEGLTVSRAPREAVDDAVAAAKERAIATARDINESTADMLEQGRELEEVFGADRAVRIGVTEARNAREQSAAFAAQARGNRVRWVVSDDPCDDCRSLSGKVVKPGKEFVTKSGKRAFNPPLHPFCRCSLEEE